MADKDEDKKDDKKPETAKDEGGDKKPELDLASVHAYLKEHAPMWQELQQMMAGSDEDPNMALDEDTKKKDGDTALDEDKKDEKKEDKKEAMDAADVERIVDVRMRASRKNMFSDVAKRDQLVKDLTPHVGTFDGSAMDAAEVAAYGVEKLGLAAKKGHEESALAGYLAGFSKNKSSGVGFAMDSASIAPVAKAGGKLEARLKNAS